MRRLFQFLLCVAIAAPVLAEPLALYDPAALVTYARKAMREGDMATACVLLSRASRLAPHDARVQLAWGDYESAQQGLPLRDEPAPAPVAAAARAAKPVASEPPAPWPAK